MVHTKPWTKEFTLDKFTSLAPFYTGLYTFHQKDIPDIVEMCELGPGLNVLEIGCGNGIITFPLANSMPDSSQVVGVDITPAMIAQCHEEYKKSHSKKKVSFQLGDATSEDFINHLLRRYPGGFDRIVSIFTLNHLPNPEKVVKLWQRLLKKDGFMVIDFEEDDATQDTFEVYAPWGLPTQFRGIELPSYRFADDATYNEIRRQIKKFAKSLEMEPTKFKRCYLYYEDKIEEINNKAIDFLRGKNLSLSFNNLLNAKDVLMTSELNKWNQYRPELGSPGCFAQTKPASMLARLELKSKV